jgi:hypothetical protein
VAQVEISEKNQGMEGGIQCFMCVQVRQGDTVIPYGTLSKCLQTFVETFLGNKGVLVRYIYEGLAHICQMTTVVYFWPQVAKEF